MEEVGVQRSWRDLGRNVTVREVGVLEVLSKDLAALDVHFPDGSDEAATGPFLAGVVDHDQVAPLRAPQRGGGVGQEVERQVSGGRQRRALLLERGAKVVEWAE